MCYFLSGFTIIYLTQSSHLIPFLSFTSNSYAFRTEKKSEVVGIMPPQEKVLFPSKSIDDPSLLSMKKMHEESTQSTTNNRTHAARRMGRGTRSNHELRRRTHRSLSSPPGYNRKSNRRTLVQQHFKIDKQSNSLLPGLPSKESNFARDCHDFFNLIVLVPIVVLNVLNWDWDKFINGVNRHNKLKIDEVPFVHAWTGHYFELFFWTTVAYFLVDLIWVCVIPKCVKSPSTIIQHHIAVFVYLIIPYMYPNFRFLMGICMSVELNTWFLIARRVFNKGGNSPWQFDIPYVISVRVKLISIFFYITWISIRCVLYPYVWYVLAVRMIPNKKYRDFRNVIMIALVLQSCFCFLNGQWSLQLLNSKIRQWKNKGKTKVASGL